MAKSHKYVRIIYSGGRKRYVYPGDEKGAKRNIGQNAKRHAKMHQEVRGRRQLDTEEENYIAKTATSLYKHLKDNGITGKDETKLNSAIDHFHRQNGIHESTVKQSVAHLSKQDQSTIMHNVGIYHHVIKNVVREHLINNSEPIHHTEEVKQMSKPKQGGVINPPKSEVGQPKPINKNYPPYHPKATPRNAKDKPFYTERYVREVPPAGHDAKAWNKAIDEYVGNGGSKGYDWNFSKLNGMYIKHLSNDQPEKVIPKYEAFKNKEKISLQELKDTPPDWVGTRHKKIWSKIVDHHLGKYGEEVTKAEYVKELPGMSKHHMNKIAKLRREGKLKPEAIKKSFYFFELRLIS